MFSKSTSVEALELVKLTESDSRLWRRDKQVLVALLCRVEPGETGGPEL